MVETTDLMFTDINKIRMNIIGRMAIVVLSTAALFLLLYLTHLHILITLFICLIASLILYVVIASIQVGNYTTEFGKNIIVPMVRQVCSSMEYDKESYIQDIEYLLSGMNSNILARYWTKEHLAGTFEHVPVNCTQVDVCAKTKTATGSSSSNGFAGFMKGLLIISGERGPSIDIKECIPEMLVIQKNWVAPETLELSMNAESDRLTSVFKKSWITYNHTQGVLLGKFQQLPSRWSVELSWKPEEIIASGNSEFDQKFILYVKNGKAGEHRLSEPLIRKILEISNEWKKDVSFSFAKQRCCAYFPSSFHLLIPNFVRPVNRSTIMRIEKELQRIKFAMCSVAEVHRMVCK